MTESSTKTDHSVTKPMILDWEEWLTVHPVATALAPCGRAYRITVVIAPSLANDHPHLPSLLKADHVIIDLETFTDGRVFSLARLLRDRLGFTGELEVRGDFLPDQLSFLERCGVNSFSGATRAKDATNYYSGFYQPTRPGDDDVTFIRAQRQQESPASSE